MIIALVSKHKRAGKSAAAQHIIMNKMSTWRRFSFAYRLKAAASLFMPMQDKLEIHPELGVSMEQVNHAISDALAKLHPELPVYRTKQEIEAAVKDDLSVVIDDLRRLREITWCREIAHTYGTTFHLIEIVPVGKALERAWTDTWQNGIEPCGRNAWQNISRPVLYNDGNDTFYNDVLRLVNELQAGESV